MNQQTNIKYLNASQFQDNSYISKILNVWNISTTYNSIYKKIELNDYEDYLNKLPNYSKDSVFIAKDEQKDLVVGFGIALKEGNLEKNKEAQAFINAICVLPEYRCLGIGSTLLNNMEQYLIYCGYKNISVYGHLPSCYSWIIPNTINHDHPCAPGVMVNSDLYLFLIHRNYNAFGFQDAFHLNLSDYEISPSINKILDDNKKDGYTIELYDESKHKGINEFCDELNLYDFTSVIKSNLSLDKPYPFLVVLKDNYVVGWTGALWNEESGRGHFDGIAILERVRGRGLGKALFSLLAYNSKLNGARFMTFYTNLNNHARYIYMGAGFKICLSFALMRKTVK